MKTPVFLGLFLAMTWMGTLASLALKKVSGSTSVFQFLFNRYLWAGGILYVGSAVINVYLLRFFSLSVILPLTSFTYVWTMAVSGLVLKQKITGKQVLGVVLIIFGAVLIAL